MNNSIQVAMRPQEGLFIAQIPANNATAFGVGVLLGIGLMLFVFSRLK